MESTSSQPPKAEIAPGTFLCGKTVKPRDNDREIFAFLGVPYAKPPVEKLRFSPPQPADLWEGERQATQFAPRCPQEKFFSTMMAVKMTPPEKQSEDCLYLNVWTPGLQPDAKRAVMVWIHGGSFMAGWSNMYQGTSICAFEDVVFVSINYRLGVYGFMTTGDEVAPGNYGLLDQIEALRWVQRNIQAFGGDPNNVTLFGQSAGGMSANILMLSEEAQGLFQRVICQSGTVACPAFFWTTEYARKSLDKFLKSTGFESSESEDILEHLRSLPEEKLTKSLSPLDNFRPVIDGKLLQAEHIASCTNPNFTPIEMLLGSNDCEGAAFAYVFTKFQVPNKEFCEMCVQKSIEWAYNREKTDVDGLTEAVMEEYFGQVEKDDKDGLLRNYVALMGDLVFVVPACLAAQAHAARAVTYMYHCIHRPSYSPYDPSWVGSDHSDEIGLALGWPFHDVTDMIEVSFNEEEAELSKKVMKYWANFAKTGNPNTDNLPEWPQYTTSNQAHLVIDKGPSVSRSLLENRLLFWKETVQKFGTNPVH